MYKGESCLQFSDGLSSVGLMIVILCLGVSTYAAEQIVNESGILVGATDVVVDGVLYDVEFIDGSCQNVFSDCDTLDDFMFPTIAAAEQASLALGEQVMQDSALGNFDSVSELVIGCEASPGCILWTPAEFINGEVVVRGFINLPTGGGDDAIGDNTYPIDFDFLTVPAMTYARWSLAVDMTDADDDGVFDAVDNCLDVPNADQRDSNGDGFGNVCDQDTNNDCSINFIDIALFANVFLSTDEDNDFDGNGSVNFVDFGTLAARFTQQPGPSALADCD